jgi:hypothetical protein
MKIKILGGTTRAKRSNAGWQSAPSTLLLTMEGGVAKLLLKVIRQRGKLAITTTNRDTLNFDSNRMRP